MAITTAKRLLKNVCRIRSLTYTSTVVIGSMLFGPHAAAAEWRIAPTLEVRQTYTDNVRLAPEGAEDSDFILDVSPGISIAGNGPGLKVKASYAFQHLRYASDSKESSSFHKLNAVANAELIKNLLFFDGTASIGQQSLSILGTRATDNYSVTGNRTTVKTVSASPYLHHDFRGIATSELRYTHTSVDTSSATFSTSRTDGLLLSVNSDPAFRTLGWGFNYSRQRNEMPSANSVDSTTASGNLRYMLSPHLHLTATVGHDKYDYVAAAGAPGPEGSFYSGGFSWRPTERTSIAASIGERFYGKTYSLNSSVRSRASVWNLSYDETITTTPSEFALSTTGSTSDLLNQLFRSSIADDALRQQAVDRFILSAGLPATLSRSVNYLTNQFFLQKTLRASVALTGAKNTVLLTAFNVSRDTQSAQGSTPTLPATGVGTTGDTRQTGINALWNWRLTALTSATFSADITRTKVNSSSATDRIKTFKAALARRLQPKLDGVIELKHVEQQSDTSGNNYQENAISAFLSMKF